jgi:hypothetical protein
MPAAPLSSDALALIETLPLALIEPDAGLRICTSGGVESGHGWCWWAGGGTMTVALATLTDTGAETVELPAAS